MMLEIKGLRILEYNFSLQASDLLLKKLYAIYVGGVKHEL